MKMNTRFEVGMDRLVNLFVLMAGEKSRLGFDPKKQILDLLPVQAMLYIVFVPRAEYSLAKSRMQYGGLAPADHRFIHFLQSAELTSDEINKVITSMQGMLTPSWMEVPNEQPKHRPVLTVEQVEDLYRPGSDRRRRLTREMMDYAA